MSAELLKHAAKTLREHAEAATPGPWEHVDYSDPSGQPMMKEGLPSTFMGCGSIITLGDGVAGGNIAAPNGDLYPRSGYSPKEDMAYVALMHPPVALALAALLLELADHIAAAAPIAEALGIEAHEVLNMGGPALAVARAVLREAGDES